MITIKTKDEINGIKKSCSLLRSLFEELDGFIKEGITTKAVDVFCENFIKKHGGKPAFLYYDGFPASACISINEEVIHGIPSSHRIIKNGDLVKVDLGINLNGYFSDSAHGYEIGNVPKNVKQLNKTTKESLYLAIDAISNSQSPRVSDIGRAVFTHCSERGFGVVKDYCGHGVGLDVHEEPSIANYINPQYNARLKEGMVIAIEPMITLGTWKVHTKDDGWTVVTDDNSVAAHWEHTVAITENGVEILT
ncbi:MAG: type I methionyl aminopeptidase [Sphaerochaetaceae bacterium]|nr:type I methionyl aminopeptidase [Sphaerochaetaceae bacterium]